MRLLVTGGAGFIGSNLLRLLVARGFEVLNLDALTYSGNLLSIADLSDCPNYKFKHASVCDELAVQESFEHFRPDSVIHLAAESHVDRSIDHPSEFVNTNVVGTVNLLQCASKYYKGLNQVTANAFRFLHVSTDEVYGSLGDTGFFKEDTRYDPRSPYSASKAASDHFVRAWNHTYGLPTLITNCSNNYGPYQFPEKLIPVVILKCLRNEPIPIYGKGDNIRDWLFVEDHCEALLQVVCNGTPGETYNIGGNNELRNIDLVSKLCGILDRLRPKDDGRSYAELIKFVDDRPGHDLRYAIDASKIKRELNWVPRQENQSGFEKTVQWYLENQSWWQRIIDGDYRLYRQGLTDSKGTEAAS